MSMVSPPPTPAYCAEHRISVADHEKEEERAKQVVERGQWLRAAILGANDGLLSTTSLMLGVGAATDNQWSVIFSGLAGALAGACSMAVGEFVSVATQRDIEAEMIRSCTTSNSKAELLNENDDKVKIHVTASANSSPASSPPLLFKETLIRDIFVQGAEHELKEEKESNSAITASSSNRVWNNMPQFLSPARSPMMKVIVRDARSNNPAEGEDDSEREQPPPSLPNPYKAAAASAVAFLCGSVVPLAAAIFVAGKTARTATIVVLTSIALASFGGFGAYLGGSPLIAASTRRVLLGGWLSMAITYALLKPFDRDDKGNDT